MRVVLFVFLGVLLLFVGNNDVLGGANDGDEEVGAILAEMRSLIIDHYQIPPTRRNKAALSPEAVARAELLDDIKMTPNRARQVLNGMKKLWGYKVREPRIQPNVSGHYYWDFPIKFAFNGSEHTEKEKSTIRTAMKMWESTTCVTFKEYNSTEEIGPIPHLFIIKAPGCWSFIGIEYPEGQQLSLGPGCTNYPGTAAHEFGHALGLWHEFSRADRDDHVKVIWENVMAGKEHNFNMYAWEDNEDPENTGYDVTSIMHYDSLGFSIDYDGKKRVMMPLDLHQLTAIGQIVRLQFNDIKRVNFAYNCMKRMCKPEQLKKTCLHGGYQDPKNCRICRCPPGTAGDDCGGVPVASGPGMTGCGGRLLLEPCSIRTIGIPPYPYPYGENAECTWRISSRAKGLAFAFQSAPDMPCNRADTCIDFVEIRTNLSAMASPGRFFCACGENRGRVVKIDNPPGDVIVRFSSTTVSERGGAGKRNGFLLNVYATCGDTLASKIPNSCVITSTGYEVCTGVSLPLCPANQTEFINPITPTTTTPRIPQPTTPVEMTTTTRCPTCSSSIVAGSFIVTISMLLLIIAF